MKESYYAAYFHQCRVFISFFNNQKFLNEDLPKNAEFLTNENGGKRLEQEDIERQIMERQNDIICGYFFSTENCQKQFLGHNGIQNLKKMKKEKTTKQKTPAQIKVQEIIKIVAKDYGYSAASMTTYSPCEERQEARKIVALMVLRNVDLKVIEMAKEIRVAHDTFSAMVRSCSNYMNRSREHKERFYRLEKQYEARQGQEQTATA